MTGSYNVQDCDVSSDQHTSSILVECTFVINSTAPGIVVIQDDQSQYTINKTLQRLLQDSDKGSVNISGLPAGEYSVRVYDDYNSDSFAFEHSSLQIVASLIFLVTTHAASSGNYKSMHILYLVLLYTATSTVFIKETPTVSSTSSSSVGSMLPSQDSYSTTILASSIGSGLLLLLVLLLVFISILIVISVARKRKQNKGIVCSILLSLAASLATDHVPVGDNPAYITMKRITLNKNTAYETVNMRDCQYETVDIPSHYETIERYHKP